MVTSYGETSGFSAVPAAELELVNGGALTVSALGIGLMIGLGTVGAGGILAWSITQLSKTTKD